MIITSIYIHLNNINLKIDEQNTEKDKSVISF